MKTKERIYTSEQVERGLATIGAFIDFAGSNMGVGQAVPWMLRTAEELYRSGRPVSSRHLLEEVRAMDFTDDDGLPVRPNNNLTAVWTRVLLLLHPEYEAKVESRPCVFDVLEAEVRKAARMVAKGVARGPI